MSNDLDTEALAGLYHPVEHKIPSKYVHVDSLVPPEDQTRLSRFK